MTSHKIDCTFEVVKDQIHNKLKNISLSEYLTQTHPLLKEGASILVCSEKKDTVRPILSNGFMSTCLAAYNMHIPLTLSPDDVWIAITTSFSHFMEKNAEELRSHFVKHEGKKEIKAYAVGTILSVSWPSLIDQIVTQVNDDTKTEVLDWLECNFSTSTDTSRFVSKLVLMGAMKHYYSYSFLLCCNLTKVTLKGTKADWEKIIQKVAKFKTFSNPILEKWSSVLEYVLQHFVKAFEGNIDKKFWNCICSKYSGGSGPSFVTGWSLVFSPFDSKGSYILFSLDKIKATNQFGQIDEDEMLPSAVEIPVYVNDNGREYNTIFYAGIILNQFEKETISPSIDWAFFDVTNIKR